jgi:hypothetical protein
VLTLEHLRTELAPIFARIDGLYVITEGLRRDVRMVRTAINDMARTDISAGEVEALHQDIDRVQTEQLELAIRLATVERLLKERLT